MPFVPSSGSRSAQLGSAIGRGLGKGFSEFLDENQHQIAKKNRLETERQDFIAAFEPIFGKEGATFLARLDPDTRIAVLQSPVLLERLVGNQKPLAQTVQPEPLNKASIYSQEVVIGLICVAALIFGCSRRMKATRKSQRSVSLEGVKK